MTRLPVLVEATRGPVEHAETRHAGAIAVVDGSGTLVASVGDADAAFPLRSTAKPIQLLPYILDGLHLDGPRGAGEILRDLAVMMASHTGEPVHTKRVGAILGAYGLTADALLCGAHWPYSPAARDALVSSGEPPASLHSNCSGKHAGMLAVCKKNRWPLQSYIEATHPLQQRIHDIVAALSLTQSTPLPHSIDGCSLPTYWVSMRGLARMYAALARPEQAPMAEKRDVGEALKLLFTAGTRHPELVAGNGFFDTRLMASFGGRLFAKGGAAGVYALAVKPNAAYPQGLGISFKVEDGDSGARARPVIACEILRQLEIQPDKSPAVETLVQLSGAAVVNVRGQDVGAYRSVFRLR